MTETETPRITPIEASDATVGENASVKKRGKGLSWIEDQNVALARAASVVCTDQTVGSCMTSATMHRKIRATFIADVSKPAEACTTQDKGPLDCRRWDGRSFVACGKQWGILRREWTKFKGCIDRVHKMQLTGNPTDEDLYRCASLIYSDGNQSASHVYDCVRNPAYHIANLFKFDQTYTFLSTQTKILDAQGVDPDGPKKFERPLGTKAAKKLKLAKKSGSVEETPTSMSASMKRIEEMLAENAAQRYKVTQQKLSFQRERMEWEMAKTLVGPGSSANEAEREPISSLLRKRLMSSLTRDVDYPQEKIFCDAASTSDIESVGASALLKISNVSGAASECVVASTLNMDHIDGS